MTRVEDVAIEALASGGDGVGRSLDGRVVFVPFTAPGDRVRVRIVAERARFLRGEALELLEAGPGRSDPLCPVFGACGGCAWQHLAYPTQLEWKRRILADAVERIARLRVPELEMHPSPVPYGYRSRARVLVHDGRVGFRRRRSHAVCATARCPILVPALDAALAALAARPPTEHGEWELTAGSDGEVAVTALPAEAGARAVSVRVGSDRLRVSSGSFLQVNAPLRAQLAEAVHAAAGRGGRALELCAGVGFFTIGLARRFHRLLALESGREALADLEVNLRAADCRGVEVRAGALEVLLGEPSLAAFAPEVAVLDPPRTGLGPEASAALARLAAPRIVYVSCDPATLARDIGVLADRGYALCALSGFDLFPQTPHVEALAVLER